MLQIRDLLERFLKDDADMHRLNLTAQVQNDLARLSRMSRASSYKTPQPQVGRWVGGMTHTQATRLLQEYCSHGWVGGWGHDSYAGHAPPTRILQPQPGGSVGFGGFGRLGGWRL